MTPVLNTADKVTVGSQVASAVYAGVTKVWPSFSPLTLPGLNVWLDASQLALADGAGVSPWPDLSGKGNPGVVSGTPPPVVRANALNGLRVVRFKPNEGRVRGNTALSVSGLPAPGYNYTIVYVTRMVGPTVGRSFAGQYPPTNFLVGFHSSGQDAAYDSGWLGTAAGYVLPTAWKLYSMTASHDGTTYNVGFYKDGALIASAASGSGLQDRYHLSGYDVAAAQETCDCEVAELVIYNRRLTDTDRQRVESYLKSKWAI